MFCSVVCTCSCHRLCPPCHTINLPSSPVSHHLVPKLCHYRRPACHRIHAPRQDAHAHIVRVCVSLSIMGVWFVPFPPHVCPLPPPPPGAWVCIYAHCPPPIARGAACLRPLLVAPRKFLCLRPLHGEERMCANTQGAFCMTPGSICAICGRRPLRIRKKHRVHTHCPCARIASARALPVRAHCPCAPIARARALPVHAHCPRACIDGAVDSPMTSQCLA